MKMNRVVVSMFAAGILAAPLAHATNGDTMMAVGSENTALGGTGVAHYVGAESMFANPAMLGKSRGREVTGGLVIFRPSVTNDGMGGAAASSAANTSYIPDVSFSSRISDNLTYGVAMAGIAGMGVDYTGAPANTHVIGKTALSILKIVPTLAYNTDSFGLGFSPVLQYGSLAISYNNGNPATGVNPAQNASTNTGYGFTLGGYYNTTPELTLAAAYNSKIKMSYGAQLSAAGTGFGQGTTPGTSVFADNLDQPAEYKAGFSYAAANHFTVTADYRLIQWASAGGYKEFGWKDQSVVALGGKYSGEGYWIGVGYNNSNNPIGVFANGALTPAGNNGGIVNMFNNLMFPGIIKSSYTLGGGYALNKEFELAGSVVYSPKVTSRVDISDAFGMIPGRRFNTTTHSQQSYSVSLRYKF
ncbi:MAG: outer membrane protein transport protein [Gallionella sp.]|nr:outer membrane protein transport protein [Gallionella sp.]